MGGLITNIFQFFIPPSVPDDAESQRKARITVAVLMIIILFNLNYYVISYLIGFTGGVLSQFPVMIVGMTILLLYRLSVKAEWLYLIYFICQPVAIAVAVYYTGGFSSVLFPWLAATPIVAVLIWSKVGGWFTISLVIAIELFFLSLWRQSCSTQSDQSRISKDILPCLQSGSACNLVSRGHRIRERSTGRTREFDRSHE